MSKNHIITILGIDQNGDLTLSDHGKTKTKPGDRVTWKISKDSGVAYIRCIVDTSPPIDVFLPKDPPHQVRGSTDWRGTIDPDITTIMEEEYCINYTKTEGTIGRHDPKILVNP